MSVKPFFIFILVAGAYCARAQQHVTVTPVKDTALKGATIEVIQSYKPEVKLAPKPEWEPQLPPADTTHPVFTYDVPQQTLYYTYSSLPLRPLALGKDITPKPFPDYVKIGGGNLSTLFLDAGIGGITGKDYETAIHLHHISQNGDIKYQQSALSGIEAEGILHKENNDWHASVSGERNQYSYYGGDQTVSFNGDSSKQTYTTIRAAVDMKSRDDNNSTVMYDPAINASLYTAKLNTSETTIGINTPFTFKIDPTINVQVALIGAFTNFNTNVGTAVVNTNNNYIELLPGIQLHAGQVGGHALLGLAYGMNSNGYLLPDVLAAYTIPDTKFTVSGGWQATLHQNTYEQLTTENPFMTNNYSIMQTRSDEAFVNLNGTSGAHITYTGRISWWAYDALPTFLNNTGDQKQFNVIYDMNLNAISLKAAVRYHVANIWSFGLSGDFYHFYNGTQQYAWHEPDMKIKGDFMIIPVPKLTVTAYLALLGGIYAQNTSMDVVKLNTIADLGGNAEYQIVSRLSAFVQLDNLLNDKYQRWLGYQAYGLNIYGGVRLKF